MPLAPRTSGSGAASDDIDHAALTRRIASGDEAAFASFYTAWFPATLALARATSRRDEAFCLDIVQDVMLAVARKMPALSDDRAVRAWMTTTVLRTFTDRLRQEQRQKNRELRSAAAFAGEHIEEPWESLLAAERQQWLEDRLAELPSGDRALLAARFGDTTSVSSTGMALGLSADAAHGRLRRVLQRLRQEAARWWHGR